MPLALPIALGVTAVAGLGAAAISSSASKSAAQTQAAAANRATDYQQAQYQQTRNDLLPYQQVGQQNLNTLQSKMGDLTAPFSMTQQNLEATPGYQFNLSQGLKATNNALGARGLLNSGAVMKGASEYATGLADNTYLNQFNMDQQNKLNSYNKLMGMAGLGESAAAQTGQFGLQTAHDVGQNMIGAGNAIAAGQVGSANAMANGLNGIGSNLLMASLMGGKTGMGTNGGIFASQYGSGGSAYGSLVH